MNKFYFFSLIQQFPSQFSLESLETSNNGNSSRSTIVTDYSLPSSPSLTSLDKISTTSNTPIFYRQHFQSQQSKLEIVIIRIFVF